MACPAGVALLAAAFGGCAHLPSGPFTPPPPSVASPLADDIRHLDIQHAAYPGWISVPSRPTDIRPKSAWTRNIYNVLRERRRMQALAVLDPQSLYGARAYAEDARAYAAAPPTAADSANQTTSFAKSGRERAKPPSPAQ